MVYSADSWEPQLQLARAPEDLVQTAPVAVLDQVRVLLVTESTYPYYWGGVSTWCDRLVHDVRDARFSVFTIVPDSRLLPLFPFPSNVDEIRTVPIWGVRDTHEWRRDIGLRELRRRRRATEDSLRETFIPALAELIQCLVAPEGDPLRLAAAFHAIYRCACAADFDSAIRSREVTTAIIELAQAAFPLLAAQHGYPEMPLQLAELTRAVQLLSGWLSPLAEELPACDVVHATMAGISGVIGVVAKVDQGAGFLLTEHGVYLRERYLAESSTGDSLFLKLLSLRFARRTTEMAYHFADLVSPCCDYNQRWELRNGVTPDKLQTIYYGIDGEAFQPAPKPELLQDVPVVVWAGRINPLKDVETLLRAAAVVHTQRPDVRFRLHGSPPAEDAAYYEECLALRGALSLDDTVEFCGFSDHPAMAYNEADVVVLSSISEGFPNSTLEAMLCAKPVVATAVGGVREQLADTGLTVEPRNPAALGGSILELIEDPDRAVSLGRRARDRAVEEFHPEMVRDAHVEVYRRLAQHDEEPAGGTGPVNGWHSLFARNPVEGRLRSLSFVRSRTSVVASPAPGRVLTVAPERMEVVDAIVSRVASAVPLPIEALEVAAVLESMGITDPVAQRLGVDDTFALADIVYASLRTRAPGEPTRNVQAILPLTSPEPRRGRIPIAGLLPPLLVLALVQTFVGREGWDAARVLALSLGAAAAMLVASTFFQGLTGRTSAYLARNDKGSALRTLALGLRASTLVALVTAAGISGVVLRTTWIERGPAVAFMATLVVLAPLWFLAAALAMVRASVWILVSLGEGAVVAVSADRWLSGNVSWHLGGACAIGGLVSTLMLFIALRVRLAERDGNKRGPVHLPSLRFMVHEAAAYGAQGALLLVLVLLPYFLGWIGTRNLGAHWLDAFAGVQRGLTLAMVPALLASVMTERTVLRAWRRAWTLQELSGLTAVEGFAGGMTAYCRRERRRYLIVLGIVTLLVGATVVALDRTGASISPLGSASDGRTLAVFLGALGAFALIGLGQFHVMILLTLVRPGLAARAELLGLLVMVGVGLPLVLAGYQFLVVGCALGGLTFAFAASRAAMALLRNAHHSFVAAV
ncbi:MAG TPA: GT4 family glycosyltransferase PelF [Acidimicrobiia bacterium]